MGYASGQKQQTQTLRLNTVNGILKITIFNAKIDHQTSSFFAMDPYLKLKVSNQTVTSKVIKKGGRQPVFNESFEFFINSCYQINGRNLQVQLWDSNKTSDSLIGFGITDLDPILLPNIERKPKPMRIFINHDVKPAGSINAEVQFKEHPIELLSFRFQTVSIRRKTSTLSDMNCFVKVTIGEEVLKTKKKKDTKEMPPVWIDDILTFNVPKVIKNCIIEVYDENNLVGQLILTIDDLLKESKEKQYDEDIIFDGAIAGSLRFQTLLGQRPQFSQIKRDYKRKVEQKPKETTKEQKKDNVKEKNGQKQNVAQKSKKQQKPKQPEKKNQPAPEKPKQESKKQ